MKSKTELIAAAEEVVEMAKRNTYSTSKVYAAHNAIFQLSEKPESCASCLRVRSKKIKAWLENEKKAIKAAAVLPAPIELPEPDGKLGPISLDTPQDLPPPEYAYGELEEPTAPPVQDVPAKPASTVKEAPLRNIPPRKVVQKKADIDKEIADLL